MYVRLPVRALFRSAFFFPVFCSWVVVSLLWSLLFAQQGLVNSVVQVLGVAPQPFFSNPAQAMWILIATTVWRNLGYYMVIYLAALQVVPQDLYDAASVDGATKG